MDADRFDSLSKRMAAPTTRRATLGAMVASAFGVGAVAPVAQAAQGQVCTMAFVATVRTGPSLNQPLTPGGNQPGQLQGELSFSLSDTGNLESAALKLANGTNLPVVGQATGHSLQLRIALDEGVALVALGVGEEEIATCEGAIDGTATGPQVGDLGEWHARARGLTGDARRARGGETRAAGGGDTRAADSGNTRATGGGNANRDRAGGTSAARSDSGTGQASQGIDPPADPGRPQREGRRTPRAGEPRDAAVPTPTPTPQPGGAQPEGALQCAAGQTACNGVCVDVTVDPANCGLCGFQCAAGELCVGGACQAQADGTAGCAVPGQTDCNGVCVNLANDQNHCGACGQACAAGEDCVNSVCGGSCPEGLSDCGDCADLMTSPVHCGDCFNTCVAGENCVNGVCGGGGGVACPDGQVDCGGACTDLNTDPFNCGFCAIACAAGETCEAGFCVGDPGAAGAAGCQPFETDCGGVCADLTSDPFNCGGCGLACLEVEQCIGGFCTGQAEPPPADCAAQGLTDCGGVCVDTSSDPTNCGGCGIGCAEGTSCIGGGCV